MNKWDAIEKDDKTIYKYTNKMCARRSPLCPMRRSFLFPQRPDSVLPKLFETIDMVIAEPDDARGDRRAE